MRVSLEPGEGVLLHGAAGLPPQVAAAARSAGARRRAGGLLMDPVAAHTLLRELPADWDPDARRAAQNRVDVRARSKQVLRAAREVAERGPDAARELIRGGALDTALDDHQALNVALMTLPGGWGACVFDEQGTGKTVSVLAAFDLLAARGEADRLLIVSPKSMVAEWQAEFGKFAGDLYAVDTVGGSRRQRLAAVDGRSDVLVLNYEAVGGLLDELVLLARRSRTVLVVDESFNIKNPDAARTGAVTALREWCTRAYVLCGTPAPHSAADVVAQVGLVDFGLTFAGLRLGDDPDRARDQVRSAIGRRAVLTRNLKSRVLPELPGRRYDEVQVDLAPRQRAAYDDAAGSLANDLREATDGQFARHREEFLRRRGSLLRMCSDPPTGADEVPGKVAALDELLRQLVEDDGEKVVLWSYYRASLDRLASRYARLGLVRVDGSVTDNDDRREAVRAFQGDDAVRVFLGNPAAAGAGITLHAARVAVYESLGGQAAHHMQSLDRVHRRGQAREVQYVTLLARDTVETAHYQRLLSKARAQADLLGDPPDPQPTRQLLLNELLGSDPRAGQPA